MSRLELLAAAAAAVIALLPWIVRKLRGLPRPQPTRASRFLLWLAIAVPLLFLLTRAEDRPQVLVSARRGAFEALRVAAFAAAAAAAFASALPAVRRAWLTVLLITLAACAGLATAVMAIR